MSNVFQHTYISYVLTTKKWTMPGDEHDKQHDLFIVQRTHVTETHYGTSNVYD